MLGAMTPPLSRLARTALLLIALAFGTALVLAQPPQAPDVPGARGGGVTLLPNGWRIAPAGRSLQVGDFPLSMVMTPDRRYLVISNNGWSKPTLTIVDTEQLGVRARVPVDNAWLGLAWNPKGTQLYSSGAADNTVNVFDYRTGTLRPARQFVVDRSAVRLPPHMLDMGGTGFIGGLAVSPDGHTLYAAHVFGRGVSSIDVETGDVQTVSLPAEAYTVLPSPDGRTVFLSLWGGAKVLALDARTLSITGEGGVGEHPNAMALSKDGTRLFVACANTNSVWALDVPSLAARERISVSMFPHAPAGTTPNALAVSPDGTTLAVADADNNTVAVVDIKTPGASEVEGFIPTGWYPTAVLFDQTGRRLFVLDGKGLTSQSNPRGPQPVSGAPTGSTSRSCCRGRCRSSTGPTLHA